MAPETPTDDRYYVYGINGSTGRYLDEPLTAQEVGDAALKQVKQQKSAEVRVLKARAALEEPSMAAAMDVDVRELREAGWGVIFARDADPRVKEALQPLLDHRWEEAGDLFRVYDGNDGYLAGDDWDSFRKWHKVKTGVAKPEQMPYYLLIVGDPQTIPYSFQYLADVERAVGRVYFDRLEDYAIYAQSVVQAEDRRQPLQLPRRATFFGTSNPDDKATRYSSEELIAPLGQELAPTVDTHNWALDTVAPEQATKARLGELLGGSRTPSLLFTATHGAAFNQHDEDFYPQHQGALVTQDWPGPREWRKHLKEDFFFSCEDVSDGAQLWGMIAVFFACFGAGTPRLSDFYHLKERLPAERLHLANQALLAPLPQRLLSHPNGGALAVAGHIERAWTTSFKEGPGPLAPRDLDAFKELFRLLMLGYPLGAAIEDMNTRYAQYAVQITQDLFPVLYQGMTYTDDLKNRVARLWTANNDARNYIIVGDPAVRLPVSVTETERAERPILPTIDLPRPAERKEDTTEAEPEEREDVLPQPEEETTPAPDEPVDEAMWAAALPEDIRADPELYEYWRDHVKSGYEHNDEMFRRILKAFLVPYHTTIWMNGIIFAVGILSFVTGVVLSIWAREALYALAFGGLSAAAFLGYFISRPLRSLEENLEFITWLGIIYNTYWTRLVAASDPDTAQQDLQEATTDATASLERLIDKHGEMSGKRNRPGGVTGLAALRGRRSGASDGDD
jgi:hypothetical protein